MDQTSLASRQDSRPLLPEPDDDPNAIDATDIVLKEGAGGYGRNAGMPAEPAPGTDSLFSGLSDIARRKAVADEAGADRIARAQQEGAFREHAAYNAESATAHDIPTWDEEAMRQKFRTSPVQAFGSVGSIFAMIASAFTRRPMTNALSAGAAALEAIKAGDKEAYEQAHTAWKDNVEVAVKRFDMEHSAFLDAGKLMETDVAAATTAMKATALKFDDQKLLFLLNNGYNKEAFDLMADRAKAMSAVQDAARDTQLFNQQEVALKAELAKLDQAKKPDDMDQNTWNNLQAARKLYAATRILGDQGKMTPITQGMLRFFQYKPDAKPEEIIDFYSKLQLAGKRTAEETMAVEARAQDLIQEAAARGETLSPGMAMMQAEAEWSESKGAAAANRQQEALASRERMAQLSADTRLAVAGLSANTRKEVAEMQQTGQNARTEFSANARKELQGLNAVARKEIEEMREKAAAERAKTAASKPGVLTTDRQMLADANLIVQQAIDTGKLDPNDAQAVADFRATTEAKLRDQAGKSKNLTAPEENVVTMAPTAMKNMTKILSLVDQSGNLITHVPTSLLGEFGGEGDGINAYNITRNQLEYDLLRMNTGGVLSSKAMHAVLDLIPPGSASLNFKRAAFQTEMANVREEIQDKVNQIEAQGKRIDPNIWESLKQFGIVPSKERQGSLIERFRREPDSLSTQDLQALQRLPLRSEDLELLRTVVDRRIRKLQGAQ